MVEGTKRGKMMHREEEDCLHSDNGDIGSTI